MGEDAEMLAGKLVIKQINAEDCLPVRQQVLWPDKPLSALILPDDESGLHLGCLDNGLVVSAGSLFIDGASARLRKFATLPEYQGRGIGTAMLKKMTQLLRQKEVTEFWFDARETARYFYEKSGFAVSGDVFYKSGIRYLKMAKQLESI